MIKSINPSPTIDPPHILILLATTTDEKLRQYNGIADAMGMPFTFLRLNEIVPAFHSAPEDQRSRRGNAQQKLDYIQSIIEAAQTPHTPHYKALKRACAVRGIPYNPEHIYFATEDSTVTVRPVVWAKFRPKLADYVSQGMLDSADNNGRQAGPAAETGPILAAVGVTRFFNLLREAALEAGYADFQRVEIIDHSTCILRRLSDPPTAQAKTLESEVMLYAHTPNGLRAPLLEPKVHIIQTAHHLSAEHNPQQPISTFWDRHLLTERDSPRGQMVRKIYEYVDPEGFTRRNEYPVSVPVRHPRASRAERSARYKRITEARVARVGTGDLQRVHGFNFRRPSVYRGDNPVLREISMESVLQGADAFVFPPFNPASRRDFTAHAYWLTSFMVGRQLESMHMNKPAVVLDTGCWEKIVKLNFKLANAGMVKDLITTPMLEGLHPNERIVSTGGVQHIATGYLDYLYGPDPRRLARAAGEVLKFRLSTYNGFEFRQKQRAEVVAAGISFAEVESFPNIGVFISANSDNMRLIEDAQAYSKSMAQSGRGVVWGAGDRHAMGAVYDGYMAGQGPCIAGFSTPTILQSETKGGCMPAGCHYSELTPDIFHRMDRMIRFSDVIAVFPGGLGTVQEVLTFLLLKDRLPEAVQDKSLVLYNPDLHAGTKHEGHPFWDPAGDILFGKGYQRMRRDPWALARSDIYMASDMQTLTQITAELVDRSPKMRMRPLQLAVG